MNRIVCFLCVSLLFGSLAFGQTKEELEAQKAEKAAKVAELKSQMDGLNGEIAGINAKLLEWPRWESGIFGTAGINFSGFNNWVSREQPNIASSSIGLSLNAYANNLAKKYFWRNAGNINAGWLKFDDLDDDTDVAEYRQANDAINLSSLFGYNLTKTLAASALGEYRSTILSNFNNPGYLDMGLGATWTPVANLVVVIHPLNYNFVFAEEGLNYESSLGAKLVADYTRSFKGVNWKTNLSTFQSYQGQDLSNWTWINSIGFKLFKGIGVGAELGLRNNKQEAKAADLDNNPVQAYYVLGLSYSISAKK